MKKDAYLIIAHKQWGLLEKLIQSIDYEQNDIYIHIDMKSRFDLNAFNGCASRSKVYFFQEYDVQWGAPSQVDTEMLLFQSAYRAGGGVSVLPPVIRAGFTNQTNRRDISLF